MTTTAPATDAQSHRIAVLDSLMDLGHELAQLVVAEAKAGTMPTATASNAYDRITRSIRRGMLLIQENHQPGQDDRPCRRPQADHPRG